jgi:hypothetical protein
MKPWNRFQSKDSPKTSQAVQPCQELLAWLILLLDDFPRSRRFALGEHLETGLIDISLKR